MPGIEAAHDKIKVQKRYFYGFLAFKGILSLTHILTINHTMGTFMRAIDTLERESNRWAREAIKKYKIEQKQQAIVNAATTVRNYENYIETLKSVHKDASDTINWENILNEASPIEPVPTTKNMEQAVHKLKHYKPSFFDKLFSSQPRKRAHLEKKVELAKGKDEQLFEQEKKKYQEEMADWQKSQELSRGILGRDPDSYRQAIEYLNPFSSIKELGTKVIFEISANYITADLYVNTDEVIPREIPSQTSTGKLSKKNMATGKSNELYQDFVCSCVLRIARELLAAIPIEMVVVNAISEMVNPKIGKADHPTILSVVFSPINLNKLNFAAIDPSDSMSNFSHNMKFSKTTGFSPVDKIDPANLLLY